MIYILLFGLSSLVWKEAAAAAAEKYRVSTIGGAAVAQFFLQAGEMKRTDEKKANGEV